MVYLQVGVKSPYPWENPELLSEKINIHIHKLEDVYNKCPAHDRLFDARICGSR